VSVEEGYRMIGPLAYMGKADCESSMCRRQVFRNDAGEWEFGPCSGWHCSYCDASCGQMGHRCDAANAILGEAARLAAAGEDGQ